MVNIFLGGGLTPMSGHVAVRHRLAGSNGRHVLPRTSNSYHDWGIAPKDLAAPLTPIAFDCDGNIEAFEHPQKRILGVMWHPERETPFNTLDLELIMSFLS